MNRQRILTLAGILVTAAAAVLVVVLPKWETRQKQVQPAPVPVPDAAEKAGVQTYTFMTGGVLLYPDMDITVLPKELPAPESTFESESCAAQGTARLYTWRDFEVLTYPDGARDKIQYIYLKTDAVQTLEGADLSTPREKIEALYGAGGEGSTENMLVYPCGAMRLVFVLGDDGYPVSIEYRSDVMQ